MAPRPAGARKMARQQPAPPGDRQPARRQQADGGRGQMAQTAHSHLARWRPGRRQHGHRQPPAARPPAGSRAARHPGPNSPPNRQPPPEDGAGAGHTGHPAAYRGAAGHRRGRPAGARPNGRSGARRRPWPRGAAETPAPPVPSPARRERAVAGAAFRAAGHRATKDRGTRWLRTGLTDQMLARVPAAGTRAGSGWRQRHGARAGRGRRARGSPNTPARFPLDAMMTTLALRHTTGAPAPATRRRRPGMPHPACWARSRGKEQPMAATGRGAAARPANWSGLGRRGSRAPASVRRRPTMRSG